MVIDIIDYTEAQFAELTVEKLTKIREAQRKKNRLVAACDEEIEAERRRLIDRGIFHSKIWGKRKEVLRAACDKEVEFLREGLLLYLNEAKEDDKQTPVDTPYPVDYALSEEERAIAVRAYYEGAYSDAKARFAAFEADAFAPAYLGSHYGAVYYYFQDLAKA